MLDEIFNSFGLRFIIFKFSLVVKVFMPDFSKFSEKLSQYIEQVKLHHTEASKAFLFLEFIRKVFPDIKNR